MRRALAVALAILLVPVAAGAVTAANGKPTIAIYASVSGTPFVDVRVNRRYQQIDSCWYVLDGNAPSGCGFFLASDTSSHWTIVPPDPSIGSHTMIVTIALTDHEQLTNSVSFTV
jgi:hypothetical protein